jgi:hypothetical protein
MTTQRRNADRISRADSPADGATVRATDPPRYRLWFWFIRLVLTGDKTVFRRVIILLFLLLMTLLVFALAARTWAGLLILILGLASRDLFGPARHVVRELSRRRDG